LETNFPTEGIFTAELVAQYQQIPANEPGVFLNAGHFTCAQIVPQAASSRITDEALAI
jgi:hypothetical protein